MLVATRDPVHPRGHSDASGHVPTARGSRIGHWVSVIQLTGSLLAIPVGLASGYSIYRANFSPETTCANLRASIVAMIDKQIDASTRRMLVRRDVEEFERTCGNVDPDAEAAFKSLLASEPVATASIPPKAAPEVVKPLALPAQEWKKSEPAPVAKPQAKETKDVREARGELAAHAPATDSASDARWLDAVRHALTTHQAERSAAETSVKPLAPPAPAPMHAAPAAAVAPVAIAPALPPAATLNTAPVPAPLHEADHPVPPASIPVTPVNGEALTTAAAPAQTSSWTDHIPFLGK